MSSEHEPTAAEIEQWQRSDLLVSADEWTPDLYPRMTNLSAGFMFKALIRPKSPERPEYVAITMPGTREWLYAVGQWNMVWEAAQFRRRFFSEEDLPKELWEIAELGDTNVVFVPRTSSRYYEYAPLVHLLPRATLERFGLPLLRGGQWPFMASWTDVDRFLPPDFEGRLARAWASVIWPHLISGSPIGAFSKDDPVRLLSHQLDFWLPAVTEVIQQTLREFPEVDKGVAPGPVPLDDGSFLTAAEAANPRMGGPVWLGEDDAKLTVAETVGAADATGRLRGILEAVRSNRVEDDFSPHWSYAREDFERKMYRKRSKTKVRFVELTDTVPVQGPESEVLGSLVTNDFLALLDHRNRQIVVLLNSGVTKKTEIAQILGYANHSPVSKRLAAIQTAAAEVFDLD